MASVRFEHVWKRFRTAAVLKDVNLEVPDGIFLALLGPSGSGKSTALRLLAGLEEPSEGQIFIGDRPVNRVPPRDRDIAMVFQSYALYPHMPVYENIAFGLRMRKVPAPLLEQRVLEAAALLDIGDLLRRKPGELSGGQRQRVALARAIVREPAVFLLDEPLSNLDAKLRVQTRAELSRLHQRLGTTFVYVTHDQVEAMTMASVIAVIHEGVIQQVGTPQELYHSPANLMVAGFIGSPAMNFVTAEVAEGTVLAQGAPLGRLEGTAAGAVVAGIRPEHLRVWDGSSPDGICLQATVDVAEWLGNELLLHLESPAGRLLARVDPRLGLGAGDRIAMAVEPADLHLFDVATGLAIRRGVEVT